MMIPVSVCMTSYSGGPDDFMKTPLDEIAARVVGNGLKIPIKTFQIGQIVEAHQAMDSSTAAAKLVVLV